MADGSTRARRSGAGPLVLALIFLAVLGAGAGFSLGTLARQSRASGSPPSVDTTTGTPAGDTPPSDTPPSPSGTRCPAHTEQQADARPLYQVFYLHTAQSEVWICRSTDGTLYYQGHRFKVGQNEDLVENDNALYLPMVEPEGSGYVATNHDKATGHVTKYHVTSQGLRIEHTWDGTYEDQPAA